MGDPHRLRASLRGLPLAAALLLAAGCGDAPTAPAERSLELEVLSGGGQRGVPGWLLPSLLVVRAVDEDGVPAPGVEVRFDASHAGSVTASVRTNPRGEATTTWRLGDLPAEQRVTATLADGSSSVEVRAEMLPRAESDLLVVQGGGGGLTGIVGFEDGFGVHVRGLARAVDSVFALPPDRPPGTSLVVFGRASRPLVIPLSGTAGIDTLRVTVEPPVRVDIDIHVRVGDYETQRGIMLEQLSNTEQIWRTEGVGIELGDVVFVDDTDPVRQIDVSSSGICSGLTPGDAVQVDVISRIDGGQYTGWGCWAGQIYMANGTDRFPYLLAHELGHTFTLLHTQTGMMLPNPPGTEVREGEIFRAHFHTSSVLNTIFGGQAPGSRRSCSAVPSPCLPEALDLAAGVVSAAQVARLVPEVGPGPWPVDREPRPPGR